MSALYQNLLDRKCSQQRSSHWVADVENVTSTGYSPPGEILFFQRGKCISKYLPRPEQCIGILNQRQRLCWRWQWWRPLVRGTWWSVSSSNKWMTSTLSAVSAKGCVASVSSIFGNIEACYKIIMGLSYQLY